MRAAIHQALDAINSDGIAQRCADNSLPEDECTARGCKVRRSLQPKPCDARANCKRRAESSRDKKKGRSPGTDVHLASLGALRYVTKRRATLFTASRRSLVAFHGPLLVFPFPNSQPRLVLRARLDWASTSRLRLSELSCTTLAVARYSINSPTKHALCHGTGST